MEGEKLTPNLPGELLESPCSMEGVRVGLDLESCGQEDLPNRVLECKGRAPSPPLASNLHFGFFPGRPLLIFFR